jgi:hypothetical protein
MTDMAPRIVHRDPPTVARRRRAGLIAASKYSSRLADFRGDVVSLRRADRRAINLAGEAGNSRSASI